MVAGIDARATRTRAPGTWKTSAGMQKISESDPTIVGSSMSTFLGLSSFNRSALHGRVFQPRLRLAYTLYCFRQRDRALLQYGCCTYTLLPRSHDDTLMHRDNPTSLNGRRPVACLSHDLAHLSVGSATDPCLRWFSLPPLRRECYLEHPVEQDTLQNAVRWGCSPSR